MRNIFKITYIIMLTVIFFITNLPKVYAGIFSDFFGHSETIFERWRHESIATNCKFSTKYIDENYDFSKMKRVFIFDSDISNIEGINIDKFELASANNLYSKKMKRKFVDKESADAFLEIKIIDWKSEYHHREPEKIVYEAYETYEGYKEVHDPFHKPPPPPHRKDKDGRRPPPPPRPHREWTISSTYFPGSRRVVTPYQRANSRRITSTVPFDNSQKVVYPEHDVYFSKVTIVFELKDAQSGKMILCREGTVNNLSRNNQMELYKGLCYSYFHDFRKIVKQVKKAKK